MRRDILNPPRPPQPPADIVARRTVVPVHKQSQQLQIPSQQTTLQKFPPWLYKPESGQDYTTNETGTLAAAVGATLALAAFQIPANTKGVIRLFTLFVDAPNLTIDVDWIVRINRAPVPGWTFTTFPRVANNLSIDFEGVVYVPEGALIDVLVRNNAATGPWTVGAQLSGWSWSKVILEV